MLIKNIPWQYLCEEFNNLLVVLKIYPEHEFEGTAV
jgi:hypothetical protein